MQRFAGFSIQPAGPRRINNTVGGTRGRGFSSRLLLLAHLALFAVTTTVLGAPNFPTKPIRMVIAAPGGSGPDVIARLISSNLEKAWGQPIVVDNRPGASGLIGAELVARSAPDGYALWMATMTQLISTTLFQRFMMDKEFTPVGLVASTTYVIATHTSVPVNSIAELINYAKAKPGQMMYGSTGQGTTTHLCMEMFRNMAGIDLMHVPYKGATMVLTDLMAGEIQVTCAAAPALPPFVKSGRVRMLGVTSRIRTMLVPGMPSISESVPGFELVGWYGILAPLGTPKEIIVKINLGLAQALKSSEIQKRLIAAGAEVMYSSPAEFAAFLKNETMKWGKVLRESNIRPTE